MEFHSSPKATKALSEMEATRHKSQSLKGTQSAKSRHSSNLSKSSSINTILAKKQAEAEAAKAKAEFIQKEAAIRRQQALIDEQQILSNAQAARVKAELNADLEVLQHQKTVAAAEAAVRALQCHTDILSDCSNSGHHEIDITVPTESPEERTKQYVLEHRNISALQTLDRTGQPDSTSHPPSPQLPPVLHNDTIRKNLTYVSSVSDTNVGYNKPPEIHSHLNPDAPVYDPIPSFALNTSNNIQNQNTDSGMASEFARFLLKRDLMLTRLNNFNDQAESFHIWKSGFCGVMQELQVSAAEELDLLVKWLGPESSKYAASLRAANASNPIQGLNRTWIRLNERYGCPEMVETAMKNKLANFPKLTNRDNKKLYELCDILSEIECMKENKDFGAVLSYFDSSSGVVPIVSKLPYGLQEKWTTVAIKYKRDNNVPFPPFSFFVQFMRDVSRARNDPSFFHETTQTQPVKKLGASKQNNNYVSAKKTEVSNDNKCPLHKSNHTLNQCRAFRTKPLEDRKKLIKDSGTCFRCCNTTSHAFRNCTETIECEVCKSNKHPTALHVNNLAEKHEFKPSVPDHGGERTSTLEAKPSSAPLITKCTQVCGSQFGGKSCSKTILVNVYPKNRPDMAKRLYAILDEQSNASLARSNFFDMFNVNSQEIPYALSSCAGRINTSGRRSFGFVLESLDNNTKVEIPVVTECNQIPDIRQEIPTPEVALHHAHLNPIAKHIPPIDHDAQILLLIGRDIPEAHHVMEQRIGPPKSPYAQRLPLGWVVVGESCLGNVHRPDTVSVNKIFVLPDGRPSTFPPCSSSFIVKDTNIHYDNTTFKDLKHEIGSSVFKRTDDDDKIAMSIEDKKFLSIMDKEMCKEPGGNWTAPLPFRTPRPRLPNNKPVALKRARILHNNLQRNETKRHHFVTFMQGILDRNHAELAPPLTNNEECWYLPIFGVYHPKKPDQLRAVFDSSAQFEGLSLNSVLLTGPDVTNDLTGVLMRFRTEPVAVTADIQQMFHCFLVREDHRNFLRFFWYLNNDTNNKLVEYRMLVHVFGNSPSPAVATFGLRRAAQEGERQFGTDVKDFVVNNFYVDDALNCLPTVDEAINLLKRTQQALSSKGNLRLHKITSNEPKVMEAFPSEDLAKDLKDLDFDSDRMPLQRSLGLYWNLENDCFTMRVSKEEKPYTRRGILSVINSLFDPLGFVAPVLVKGKIILRQLMSESSGWDDLLPVERQRDWEDWKDSLIHLENLEIPRTYTTTSFRNAMQKELHVFSDASEQAVSAVVYLKTTDVQGQAHIGFVMGKSKVAPSHGHTIPRLELCAAVLAVELADLVTEHLDLKQSCRHFYTDSKLVLGYISNQTRRFYVYVANRVERIRKSTTPEQWKYVHTDSNPADLGTRSVQASDIGHSVWLQGPTKVLENATPTDSTTYSLEDPNNDKEVRPEIITMDTNVNVPTALGCQRFCHFSSWRKLVNSISFLRHITATYHCKGNCKGWHFCRSYRTVENKIKSETYIMKQVQLESYPQEVACLRLGKPLPKTSKLTSLDPILDTNGLIRVGGRINKSNIPVSEKNPIIIPGKEHIATLLIRHYHEEVKHQGRHLTEGAIRTAGFWIVGGKRSISSLIHRCVLCRKQRGRTQTQKMSELPVDRLTPGPPFSYVGVDAFGPWSVVSRKTRGGQASSKRWAILFTCMTTRAIHIEVIEEMSSSSFINALRRFTAIRGKVVEYRSDRGTNFVGATDNLAIDAINVEDDHTNTFLYNKGAKWTFNSPHSSHMGGAWERLIGVVRPILSSMMTEHYSRFLTHEVLTTFMAEVTAIVNARPIVPVSTDAQFPTILSPSMLLTQKPDSIPEFSDSFDSKDMYKAHWKRVQALARILWDRWRKEYLHTLQTRRKWKQDVPPVKQGDVVLLKEQSVHRNQWPTGIVLRTIPSEDNRIRKVEIRVNKDGHPTTYIRPISELTLLLSE